MGELEKEMAATEMRLENNTRAKEGKEKDREKLEEWNNGRRNELTREIRSLEGIGEKLEMKRVSLFERIGMHIAIIDEGIALLRIELEGLKKEQRRMEKESEDLRESHRLWNTCRNRCERTRSEGSELPNDILYDNSNPLYSSLRSSQDARGIRLRHY